MVFCVAEGKGVLAVSDEAGEAAKPASKSDSGKPRARPRAAGADGKRGGTVGSALRSVYDQTVQEDVPAEFLDLLNKLR